MAKHGMFISCACKYGPLKLWVESDSKPGAFRITLNDPRKRTTSRDVKAFIRRLQPMAPVNITGIAKVLGLGVWESSTLPDNIAGKLFVDKTNGGANGYSVVVRAQDPLVRKRFTVAHEIGHFLLHRNLFAQELVDNALYRSGLSNEIEVEANYLAAELLMPWHLIAPVADRPIRELAQIFEVSEQAMQIRLASGARKISLGT